MTRLARNAEQLLVMLLPTLLLAGPALDPLLHRDWAGDIMEVSDWPETGYKDIQISSLP